VGHKLLPSPSSVRVSSQVEVSYKRIASRSPATTTSLLPSGKKAAPQTRGKSHPTSLPASRSRHPRSARSRGTGNGHPPPVGRIVPVLTLRISRLSLVVILSVKSLSNTSPANPRSTQWRSSGESA
jgi:hypothetical protein